MKLVKSSAIAVAVSALLVGPVLAQGASSDGKMRGGAKTMQSGAPGSGDEEMTAGSQKPHAKSGTKGTVGAASGAPKGTGGAAMAPTGR
jgi:hypothetical protein